MSKQYDLAVFIGRMAPIHFGHTRNIDIALDIAKEVIVMFGSINATVDERNPFSYEDRRKMLYSVYGPSDVLHTAPLYDIPANEVWAAQVVNVVRERLKVMGIAEKEAHIVLVGHKKDQSSFYLDLFPDWDFRETGAVQFEDEELAATQIRQYLFEGKFDELEPLIPSTVFQYLLENFINCEIYQRLCNEYQFHKEYPTIRRERYPINDVTADSVVLCHNHILLIRRKNTPGKGLLALPGGFVQTDETVEEAAIRELIEETQLHVPEKVIRGSVVDEKRFDNPNRSLRGRIITFAFTIKLAPNHDGKLPRVYGSDDADKAFWVPIADIIDNSKGSLFFEDHHHIIRTMIDRLV